MPHIPFHSLFFSSFLFQFLMNFVKIFILNLGISIDQYKLTGFKGEYFHKGEYFPQSEDCQPSDNKPFRKGYKSVLTSKSSEETMVGIKFVTQTLVCIPKIKNYLNSILFNFNIYFFDYIYIFKLSG